MAETGRMGLDSLLKVSPTSSLIGGRGGGVRISGVATGAMPSVTREAMSRVLLGDTGDVGGESVKSITQISPGAKATEGLTEGPLISL